MICRMTNRPTDREYYIPVGQWYISGSREESEVVGFFVFSLYMDDGLF